MKKILKRFPNLFYGTIVWLMSWFKEKNDFIWIFGSWEGCRYSDNSKYLMDYIIEFKPGIKCYWVSNRREVIDECIAKGIPVVDPSTFNGCNIIAKAGVAVTTHGATDLMGCISRKCLHVYLTHGVPIKKIGYDVKSSKLIYSVHLRKIINSLYFFRKPDIIFCANEVSVGIFNSAFNIDVSKIYVTGYPRWKPILEYDVDLKSENISILYAPTLRGFGDNSIDFCNEEELVYLAKILLELNAKFYVRPHPALKINGLDSVYKKYPNLFIDYSAEIIPDINIELGGFDVLISDYSSIVYDFTILNRPILIYAPDFEDYANVSPGLYGGINKSFLGEVFNNWKDVSIELGEILTENKFIASTKKDITNVDSINDEIYGYILKNINK